MKITGSGWQMTKVSDEELITPDFGFDPNEPLDFGIIDEINKEENKAQEAEAKDWWRK